MSLLLLLRKKVSFPSVVSDLSGSTSFGVTSIPTGLPAGVVAGDLLIVLIARLNATTLTWPAGWGILITDTANNGAFEARYKKYQTGDTAPTVTSSTGSAFAWRSLRISGQHSTTTPEASVIVIGSSTAPNPAILDPVGWGIESTLWIAVESDNNAANPTSYPVNYINGIANHGASGPNISYATRKLAVSSEDPGAFAIGSQSWAAATIAIRPASQYINTGFTLFFTD